MTRCQQSTASLRGSRRRRSASRAASGSVGRIAANAPNRSGRGRRDRRHLKVLQAAGQPPSDVDARTAVQTKAVSHGRRFPRKHRVGPRRPLPVGGRSGPRACISARRPNPPRRRRPPALITSRSRARARLRSTAPRRRPCRTPRAVPPVPRVASVPSAAAASPPPPAAPVEHHRPARDRSLAAPTPSDRTAAAPSPVVAEAAAEAGQ